MPTVCPRALQVLQQNLSKSRQGQQQWRLTCDNLVKAVKQTELEGQHFDKTHQDAKENQKKLEEVRQGKGQQRILLALLALLWGAAARGKGCC